MSEKGEAVERARPGRKPRFSSEELERRTLEAALDVVLRAGVSGGLDAIRIEKVIVEADVPRGATYDLWDARGAGTSQENLRRATIIEIIRNMPSGNAQRTGDYAMESIAAHNDAFASGDRDQIRAVRTTLIRDVARFNFSLLQDQRWRVYKTLTASVATQKDAELRAAVAHGEEALLDAYGALFDQLAVVFGLQLRSGYEMLHFVMSVYALNEGLSNRVSEIFANQLIQHDGVEWTVFAVGFDALLDRYFTETIQP